MSGTPRTDQVVWYDSEAECDVVSADFARELETECEMIRAEADDYRQWYYNMRDEMMDLRSEMYDLKDQLDERENT
jgi:hypothetical protein